MFFALLRILFLPLAAAVGWIGQTPWLIPIGGILWAGIGWAYFRSIRAKSRRHLESIFGTTRPRPRDPEEAQAVRGLLTRDLIIGSALSGVMFALGWIAATYLR